MNSSCLVVMRDRPRECHDVNSAVIEYWSITSKPPSPAWPLTFDFEKKKQNKKKTKDKISYRTLNDYVWLIWAFLDIFKNIFQNYDLVIRQYIQISNTKIKIILITERLFIQYIFIELRIEYRYIALAKKIIAFSIEELPFIYLQKNVMIFWATQ